MHSNLAFPLLRRLTEIGDPLAKKVFKEEILLRLESGFPSVIIFLIAEKYIDYLEREAFLSSILNEKDAFAILEIEKFLKINLKAEYENFDFCDENVFMFYNKKVIGLKIFDLNVESVIRHITKLKNLSVLCLVGCNMIKLPHSIEELKNLIYLDLSVNKLEFIPMEIKVLPNLQRIYLSANKISNLKNIGEISKYLEHLSHIDLSGNKINTSQNKLEQIELEYNIKIDV